MPRKSYIQSILSKELIEETYTECGNVKKTYEKLGVSKSTLYHYMNLYNIKRDLHSHYKCDHDFFSRDNEHSFYAAGFICADGSINHKLYKGHISSKKVAIGLSIKDRDFLSKLMITMGVETPIHDYEVKTTNPKWNNTWKSEVQITSERMVDDLIRFGATPRKSLTLEFPEWMIDHPLRHHFIRGYNCGDGSFYSAVSKNKTVKQVFFSLRGTVQFLTTVRSIFEKDIGLEPRTTPIRVADGIGVLQYGGNALVKKIAEYLYKDQTICLERKRIAAFAFEGYDTNPVIEDLITKEALEKRYLECKSLEIVAKELGISSGPVRKMLKKYNIPIFDAPQTKSANFHAMYSAEDLRKSYEEHNHNMAAVARQFSVGHTTIMRYLKNAGII